MGARASYVLVENGRTTLYYSHWGADTLVRSVFFGPGPATEVVRSAREEQWLLRAIKAQGSILLDIDARRLTFYQGYLSFHPELRRILLPLMQTNWPGWELRWAHGEIVEIADLIGADSSILRDPVSETDIWFDPPELSNPPDYLQSWVTIGDGAGVRDLAFEDCVSNLLALGPAFFDAVLDWPSAALDDHKKLEELEQGAFLDRVNQTIALWATTGCHHERCRDILQSRWPGWTIEIHHEGFPGHWARTGRDPAVVSVGEAAILRQITELLIEDSTFNPQQFLDHLQAQGEEIEWVHPYFLDAARPATDAEDRAAILARSITRYRQAHAESAPT